MTQKKDSFEDFFEKMSNKPNIKNTDSLIENLKEMEKNIKKAESLTNFINNSFRTPEVKTAPEETTKNQTGNPENEETKLTVEIEYFTKKNPATWGFAWVAGLNELKNELRENFIKPLQFKFMVKKLDEEEWTSEHEEVYKLLHNAYEKFSVSIPTGMLLYGPPWTGKTFLTKKLAQELDAGLIKKSVWEFGSSYIHQTSKNIKEFFDAAKKASEQWPTILFLDEIDSLVSKRLQNVDANKAEEVSQFLQEFNELEEAPNLIVIAATNRPDHLDSALLRSGRLDKKVYIWPPDFEARKELFKIFIEKESRPHKKLDYKKLAELTEDYVAADLENIVKEVSRDASQNILELAKNINKNSDLEAIKKDIEKSVITMELLEKAIKETTPSTKFVDMSIYENWEKGRS